MPLPNLLATGGLLLWVAYEVLLRHRTDATATDWQGGDDDRGSTRLLLGSYAVAGAVTVVFTHIPAGHLSTGRRWIGVALIAVGLAVRAWGMSTLGRFYTRTLRTTEGQRIVQEGPYRLIRHPGYCGSLLVWSGYPLGLGNWISCVIVTLLLLSAYTWRINAEEKLLLGSFGEQYARYQERTKRLVPFLY
ncbi:methyltransferase family protein [Streptomyces sp. NPDC091259]|uniref:methyltransferase family protein n=1 Tax=Streptomyces sp. NPDC091259 TaxID=3365976 RepID=UPI0037F4F940